MISGLFFTWRANLRWLLFYSAILIFFSCASNKYKKVKDLYDSQEYQQLVQSDLDCNDFSRRCFQIKLLLADSQFRLGNVEHALRFSEQALERQHKENDLHDLYYLHLLRTEIIFKLLPEIGQVSVRCEVLKNLGNELLEAIEHHGFDRKDTVLVFRRNELMVKLGEIYLYQMDWMEQEELERYFEAIKNLTQRFPSELRDEGYEKYFLLQGEFKLLLPQLKTWSSRGNLAGEREQLLEKLKSIYVEGLTLRRQPLYQDGYDYHIDSFLKQLDQYMKQLVL